MATSRIDIFKQMLDSDPANTSILFGLAKEYEKTGATEEMIETLNRYLAAAEDQGNAYGMLARAFEKVGRRDEARATYERGIEVATRHGHPGMAEEYRQTLSSEYEA
jgi:predicted Zn-dependent protease